MSVLKKFRLLGLKGGAIISAVMALVVAVVPQSAFAANAPNVMSISPLRTDITIAPGASKQVPITVINPTSSAVVLTPIENDFVANGDTGTPSLILNANQYAPTHSLKRFMTPLSDITVPAKGGKTVNVTITVPKDAQAGGYFGAVRFAPSAAASGGQVNLSANVASIILLTVPGPTVEKLNLTDFDIQQNGHSGTNFRTPDNLQAFVRFQNVGNLQEAPFGTIAVTQGNKTIYEYSFNNTQPRDMVLPDSARSWTIPLKNIGSFGEYTVTATLAYGKNNQTVEATRTFWVVPWSVIIGGIVAIVVLIALIVGIWLFLRGYKRRILRSHRMGR